VICTSVGYGKLGERKKSESLGDLETQFNIFIPAQASDKPCPVIYYLAGLTCNEDTGAWKGGFIRDAAEENIALVFPDTSPRGAGVEGEDDDWDFGTGAGFYLNASNSKYAKHYRMYDFIVTELPQAISALGIGIDFSRSSIFGHSMGGHGALTIYLRNPERYRSASAFAAIFNPSNPECKWGRKAFSGYLERGREEGKDLDATELIRQRKGAKLSILADYGDEDKFYKEKQLLPEPFIEAVKDAGFSQEEVNVRRQAGYDHSYYFVSTFSAEHIKFHAQRLRE